MSHSRRASAFRDSVDCIPQVLDSALLHQRETLSALNGIASSIGRIRASLGEQHNSIRKQTKQQESVDGSGSGIPADIYTPGTKEQTLQQMAMLVIQDQENIAAQVQAENKQLHECIAEYEGTMTVLVQKHKDQMVQAQAETHREKQSFAKLVEKAQENSAAFQTSVHQLNEQLQKSHTVIKLASESNEAELSEREITISRLQAENEGLRQLMQISDLGDDDV